MGRPTYNPKDAVLKVYFDKETAEKLDICIKELGAFKSEIVRLGVKQAHDDLNKKRKRRTPTKVARHFLPNAAFKKKTA